ncbi:hypothetical protein AKUG0702_13420 [Apilactobacillus kunkeei]|nr:hypothetical protein AKUG0702_13420 [Apilactobacillus kunkeei]
MQQTQSFFMLFAYGVFLFGAICMGMAGSFSSFARCPINLLGTELVES